jgi:hypothetical protein
MDNHRTALMDRYGCLLLTASIILIAMAMLIAYLSLTADPRICGGERRDQVKRAT